jgi:16S rRNA (guanine966-N2)-methyltransferase
VRVVAGRFRGRRLQAPRGGRTRPTAEMVREAVFAMLGDVTGARVLDLFAGTGALGIEALSRGAARAVFAEPDHAAHAVLAANLRSLGLRREEAVVRRSDAARAIRTARGRGETYDLVFIDPPYGQARARAPALGASLPPLLAPGARVVVESDRRAPLELDLPVIRSRRYGDTIVTIHSDNEPAEPAPARGEGGEGRR